MITVTIRQTAQAKGVDKAYQLQLLLDCSPSLARNLWIGKKLPKLETLDRVCEVLDCDLKDLINRTGSDNKRTNGGKRAGTPIALRGITGGRKKRGSGLRKQRKNNL